MPKTIPVKISNELQLPVSYAILRGMKSKKAIRNITDDGKATVWIKAIRDIEELGDQLHIHLRVTGCDFWEGTEPETVDVDFYIPLGKVPIGILRSLGMVL